MDKHDPDAMLQAAIQLEELGADLYESLSSLSTDPALVRLFRGLSRTESEHVAVFTEMRSQLAIEGRKRPMADIDAAEARRLLRDNVIPGRAEMLQALAQGSMDGALAYACELERNAISFYRSLARYQDETDMVLHVLREEEDHLRSLERLRTSGAIS